MSAKKCKNCGEVVLPYYDKTTGAKKCPKCEAYIESPIKMPREVIIKDIKMSFGSMIAFMVKWAFASIPAIIIITIIISFCFSVIDTLITSVSK